ncbi:MAG: c-type cytochrome [Pseudomonadota bacterium]|nr:c-type cytochrome [Pseudomonadota bacterium]
MKKNSLFLTTFSFMFAGLLGAVGVARAQDANAGAKKVDMCLGCHNIPGYQASFPEVYKVPKIAGQNAKYIIAALTEYKKGDRKFASMHAVAVALSDQDMADVAAYYQRLGKGPAVPDKPADPPPSVAKLLAQANCVSCHGSNFSKPIDPSYPKLAGQYADYLYAALKAYQTDGNPHVGRNNPIMMGMARPFTHAEIKAIAEYISSLPGEIKTVQLPEFR